jgi:hypothetical protein
MTPAFFSPLLLERLSRGSISFDMKRDLIEDVFLALTGKRGKATMRNQI